MDNNLIDITNENILQKTKDFIEKAKSKMEKPKDEPRYKTIVQYESQFKTTYATGLGELLKVVLSQYKKKLKSDVTLTS